MSYTAVKTISSNSAEVVIKCPVCKNAITLPLVNTNPDQVCFDVLDNGRVYPDVVCMNIRRGGKYCSFSNPVSIA